jgi:subtilisin family serine protease
MTSLRLRISRTLGALALGAAALPFCAPATAAAQAAPGSVDLIVRRDAGLDAAERAEVRADAGVRFERRLRVTDTEVVTVPADRAAAALAELEADPDVRWAQRDGLARAQAVTTDPSFGQLWGLRNTGQLVAGDTAGTPDADIDVPEAWAQSTGAGVTVAVVDTGVDPTHPDLQGQLATNAGEMGAGRASNGVDDDHDGLVDDWRGYDFVYHDNDPSDVEGHGSHVAGTIAARNGNGVGITGLAPDARILPLKALGDNGTGSWSAISDAFDYAGDAGIRVVNASLGGIGELPVLSDVIAQHPNTLYVVSAGNDNADMDSTSYTPCEVPQPNVLCVGASDSNDEKAGFSNHSPVSVDVFSPGVLVLSSSLGEYWYTDGTSMASPHVAGEAALLVARLPTLSALEVKAAIMQSAEPKAALADYGHKGGRANAQAALTLVATADDDGDGVPDVADNCPHVANPGQADRDGDGTGDACDARPDDDDRDPDADGVANAEDNCPALANAGQADRDGDGTGDACDATPDGPDTDADGVGAQIDNCPSAANPGQDDVDHDGTGDVCDATPRGPDVDGDGPADIDDNCPSVPNPAQGDADHDGTGDACDATPRGGDADHDGVADLDDACPFAPGVASGRGCPVAVSGPAPPAPLPVAGSAIAATPPAATLPPVVRTAIGAVRTVAAGRPTCRAGRCTRTVDVAAGLSAGAKVTNVTALAKVCSLGRCTWRTVARSRTAKVRLPAGRYRLTVTAAGPGGKAAKTVSVTVRQAR